MQDEESKAKRAAHDAVLDRMWNLEKELAETRVKLLVARKEAWGWGESRCAMEVATERPVILKMTAREALCLRQFASHFAMVRNGESYNGIRPEEVILLCEKIVTDVLDQ